MEAWPWPPGHNISFTLFRGWLLCLYNFDLDKYILCGHSCMVKVEHNAYRYRFRKSCCEPYVQTLHYLINSVFHSELPWISCGNWWNTDCCSSQERNKDLH